MISKSLQNSADFKIVKLPAIICDNDARKVEAIDGLPNEVLHPDFWSITLLSVLEELVKLAMVDEFFNLVLKLNALLRVMVLVTVVEAVLA